MSEHNQTEVRRCGTCRRWTQVTRFNRPPMGTCSYVLGVYLPPGFGVSGTMTVATGGADCREWRPDPKPCGGTPSVGEGKEARP